MSLKQRSRWRYSVGLGAGLLLSSWAPGVGVAAEPAPAPQPGPAAVAPAPLHVVTLDECLQYAYDHQPNLAAARASLASAETSFKALSSMHASPLVPGGRELPIRRQQASLGVCIAQAALVQAEYDAAYAVRRTYLAAQYANAQLAVTQDLITRLKKYNDAVEAVLDDKEARVKDRSAAGRIAIYYRLARSKNEEAKAGVERARAALREAMGAGPEVCFQISGEDWFRVTAKGQPAWIGVDVCKGDIVSLALARRGEVGQTTNLSDVHRLEVDAQGKTCLIPTVRTFAAGSDIHSRPVPTGFDDGSAIYRPGALAPEMPTLLVGPKCDRQERAQNLTDRAGAVADKTSNLIALEAEDAYWRWSESRAKTADAYKAAEAALVLLDPELEKAFDTKEDAVKNLVFAAQGRATYNEALYQYLVSLATLERVTAGGFTSGLGSGHGPACSAPLPAAPQ